MPSTISRMSAVRKPQVLSLLVNIYWSLCSPNVKQHAGKKGLGIRNPKSGTKINPTRHHSIPV